MFDPQHIAYALARYCNLCTSSVRERENQDAELLGECVAHKWTLVRKLCAGTRALPAGTCLPPRKAHGSADLATFRPPHARSTTARSCFHPTHRTALVRYLHLCPERVQAHRHSGHRGHVARSPVHYREHSALGPLTEHMHADRRDQGLQRRQLPLC
jgi:hypothetical protein